MTYYNADHIIFSVNDLSGFIYMKPQVKLIVVLGELGGRDEYSLVEALKQGKVTKPVVAWVSGTCATLFKSEVQFGHAVCHCSFIFWHISQLKHSS